jgi:1,4-alpha-glucan branching enzyme
MNDRSPAGPPSLLARERAPSGAHVTADGRGVTFKVWAPHARTVILLHDYRRQPDGSFHAHARVPLQRLSGGYWFTYLEGGAAGLRYMYEVHGPLHGGSEGLKRDPHARDLTDDPAWPHSLCYVDDPAAFPWHDRGFRPPPFHELRIYQLHVGSWFSLSGPGVGGTFLDVASKLPYLARLGINAIQFLPVVEYPTEFSLGYNGVDYFSPETDYGVRSTDERFVDYVDEANRLLTERLPGALPYPEEVLHGTMNQLRVLVDLCHVYGIAAIFDVVYNHAGGGFDDQSLYFFDRQPAGDQNRSLYFTDRGWAGGLVFAYWNEDVRQFLIDNAVAWLRECHVDGFRYDEVSVIRHEGGEWGYRFCQDVTDTCRYIKPEAIHIAEHWPPEQFIVSPTAASGAGFDACLDDGLREAIRSAVFQASLGAYAPIDMDRLARHLTVPLLHDAWRGVQMCENHDIVREGRGPRIPRLADGSDPKSWYARSRSRVALGLVLTAPGIPHIFMGQESLESHQWSDYPGHSPSVDWEDVARGGERADFVRFTRELLGVRASEPALSSSGIRVFHVHGENRVLAFHRWVPEQGRDVVVVFSLKEVAFHDYWIGLPLGGSWRERFNSDAYERPGHLPTGNGGWVDARGGPLHGFAHSAPLTLPACGLLVLTRA